jgi:hypothetical protein
MSNISVAFQNQDFAYHNLDPTTFDTSTCSTIILQPKPDDCTSQIGLNKCIEYEGCRNKLLADQMLEDAHVHNESTGRMMDHFSRYDREIINCINLGIGIVLCGVVLIRTGNPFWTKQ